MYWIYSLEKLNALKVHAIPNLDAKTIHFLEQPVGSGKTGLIISKISSEPLHSRMFVTPTIQLGKEVRQRLKEANVENIEFLYCDQDSTNESVRKRVKNSIIKHEFGERHVLILTTISFLNLLEEISPNHAGHYNLYLDEGIDAIKHEQFKAEHMEQFTELLSQTIHDAIKPAHGFNDLLNDVAKRPDRITKLGKENLLTPKYVTIAKMVTSPLYDVRANISNKSISAIAILKPNNFRYFKSVTMIAAIWSQSILALIWEKKHDVKIKPLTHNYDLYDTHGKKGAGIEIYYCLHPDDKATGQNLSRDIITGDVTNKFLINQTILHSIAENVDEFFSRRGLKYCWNANKNFRNPNRVLSGERMPARPSGLNEWKDIDNVAALVCLNPPTWVKNILLSFLDIDANDELESETIYRRWRLAHTYQTIGRCSLRDRNCKNGNVVVVLSKECAEDISKYFVGSKIVGRIGKLPSLKKMAQVARCDNKIKYEPSDNKAWYWWKKRNPNHEDTKQEWYQNKRRYNKVQSNRQIEHVG